MTNKIVLSDDFIDFFTLLNKHKVRYLVVGSWAVGLHGRPRYTKDIDILISRDKKNSPSLMSALTEFGFGSIGLSESDFQRENYVIQLGYEPNRIDILTNIDGVSFDEAEKRADVKNIQNLTIPILAIDDLIKAKRAASRPQDLADIAQLERLIKSKK